MIKDGGDIGSLYYKVVSRIRRRNRKVQTPISPLIIFSITLLRTFCNSLFKLFFKFFSVRLYCTVIKSVGSPQICAFLGTAPHQLYTAPEGGRNFDISILTK